MNEKKFHINLETGVVGECTASVKNCRYAVNGVTPVHYFTREEAAAAYEEMMSDHSFPVLKNNSFESQHDEKPRKYVFTPFRAELAEKRIDKANKALERHGIKERFEYTVNNIEKTEIKNDVEYTYSSVEIVLSRPKISFNGYKFLARVEPLEGTDEFIAYTSPGEEMEGWRPEGMICEHCNKNRHRSKVYVVEDKNGVKKTVGASCLKAYTGLSPSGLSALEWDDLKEIEEEESAEWDEYKFSSLHKTKDSDTVLALAYAFYKKHGYENKHMEVSTKKRVVDALECKDPEEFKYYEESFDVASRVDTEKLRSAILDKIGDQNSDWATNVKSVLKSNKVSLTNIGILISSISALKKKVRNPYVKGFLGEKGEKLKEVQAVVEKVQEREDYYGYHPTISFNIVLRTDDDHKVFIKTSVKPPEPGKEVVFNGTVKNHSVWENVYTTRIVRPKWLESRDPEDLTTKDEFIKDEPAVDVNDD